ncbi:nucleolar protein 14 [Phyllosticta paracitricarpa]|uniref:Nucleolar protein 14 n=1 Tax=Phyllosticta paracitricarpa TaxID=2016321 RepID=A0ABR1MT68_9PEZI
MPPSQLKRLKASLREQGITGPQKSKKEKKRAGKDVAKRAQRNQALESIRDSFNPFEIKAKARPEKFQSTSLQKKNAKDGMVAVARPGVTKSLGEETRRKMLLPELQKRNKTGGIIDRRIGENDPTMTLEDKMLERFTRERSRKKGNVFDLEDDADDEEVQLTHGGMALNLSGEHDDFDAGSLEGGSDDDGDVERKPKRRRNNDDEAEAEDDEEQPEKKKTKAEVMKEVIAKSKMHKYERQQEKEDDEDLREKLDEGMLDMLAELGRYKKPPPPPPKAEEASGGLGSMDPERAKLMNPEDKKKADKEYDRLMREMKLDKRAAPTTRVKSDEEKAKEEAERLKELEQKRLKRMMGEDVSSEDEQDDEKMDVDSPEEDDEFPDDAAQFGLKDLRVGTLRPEGIDDEDDFEIDGDLVASGSDIDEDDVSSASGEESSSEDDEEEQLRQRDEDEEVEFVGKSTGNQEAKTSKLSYTYPCPRSHEELLKVVEGVAATDVPTVVQRIRALYHPQLSADNREKMEDFSKALVDHISYMASQKPALPLAPIETLIRHIHSLSRTFPTPIAQQFRHHLSSMSKSSTIAAKDMMILTAIGTIYPTSDHFHQVVTPAITIMARWLGLTTPQGPEDLLTGAYVSALSLKYQTLSKRYIPELVRFTTLALKHPALSSTSLTSTYLTNVTTMTSLWSTTPAFTEVFTPSLEAVLSCLRPKPTKTLEHLRIQLSQARLARRPQALHNWKPLAIKTSVPKFEDDFNPDKHYDPDQERREAAKLRAEYKREKKGALRELRKDASFVAREKLREKKERDAAYEAKYKRIVAEIQGEEGRESKAYERERAARKKNRM